MTNHLNFPERAVTRLMNNPARHTFVFLAIACYAQAQIDSSDEDIDVGGLLPHISPQAWRAQAKEVMQIIEEATREH